MLLIHFFFLCLKHAYLRQLFLFIIYVALLSSFCSALLFELWFVVPQCVIIESRAAQEVEGGMEAVNDFVKTAPTFIAKVQVP